MVNNKKYLVVDLDRSLLKIDLFIEYLGRSLFRHSWFFIKSVFFAIQNKARAKKLIVKNFQIDWHTLPYNNKVIEIVNEYKAEGYSILLATGSPKGYAQPIAYYLGLFDDVIASDEDKNYVGSEKLKAIIKKVGDDFIYLADSKKDLPIWLHCKKAILVGKNNSLKKNLVGNDVEIVDAINTEKSLPKIMFRQLRIHQWAKNILLFVPALASHQILEISVLINAFIGFLAFSLLASSIYILNDIVDVDHDRKHPKKKNRPIASGDLSMFTAYAILFICIFSGGILAQSLGTIFLSIAVFYVILNLLYSFYLKRVIILDLILLMSFYTLRLIAGHIPDAIPLSPWLLSFSIFLFFSLGLLKRYVDTIIMREENIVSLSGRGYSTGDGNMLMSLGVGSGLVSALVLILYTGSEQVQQFYATPMLLVALAPVMLYWISRMWLMAERGLIKIDPVLFAIKDRTSYISLFISLVVLFIASINIEL